MDGNEVLAGRMTIDAPLGWVCPGCGRIYSPQHRECAWCAPQAGERLEQLREAPESAAGHADVDRWPRYSSGSTTYRPDPNLRSYQATEGVEWGAPIEIRSPFWRVGQRAWIGDVLVDVCLAAGSREARRLLAQGGVFVNDVKVTDEEQMIEIAEKQTLRVGRHKIVDLYARAAECPSA